MVYRKLTYGSPPYTPLPTPVPLLVPILALALSTPLFGSPSASNAPPLGFWTLLMTPIPAMTPTPGSLSYVEYAQSQMANQPHLPWG
jgi:hypothetical protein